jgi:hypothetical protein
LELVKPWFCAVNRLDACDLFWLAPSKILMRVDVERRFGRKLAA